MADNDNDNNNQKSISDLFAESARKASTAGSGASPSVPGKSDQALNISNKSMNSIVSIQAENDPELRSLRAMQNDTSTTRDERAKYKALAEERERSLVNSTIRETTGKFETISDPKNIKKAVASLAQSESVKSAAFRDFGYTTRTVNGEEVSELSDLAHMPSSIIEQMGSRFEQNASKNASMVFKEYLPLTADLTTAGKIKTLSAGGEMQKHIQEAAGAHQSNQMSAAMAHAGLKRQHQIGMSDEQRLRSEEEIYSRYEEKRDKTDLRRDVRKSVSAGTFDMAKEEKELKTAMDDLRQKTKDWTSAIEKAKNATDQNREELVRGAIDASRRQKEAEEVAKKQQAKVDEAMRQGADDPNRRIGGLQAFAGIASTVVSGIATSFVDQPIQDVRQKAMIANKMVGRYEMGEAAISGDMHSLLKIKGLKASDEAATDISRRQRFLTGVDIAAEGFDAAAKTKLAAAGGVGTLAKTVLLGGDKELYGKGVDAAQHIARTANKVTGALNKIQETNVQLEMGGATEALNAAQTKIPAKVLQSVFDQSMAASGAVMGLGGAAQSEYAALTNTGNMERMAKFGVSAGQYAQLAGMATNVVGAQESSTAVAERAAEAQSRNIMSAQAFIQNTGALANVGGKSSDLFEIIKSATAAGMDNSKNIGQMVQATTVLSEDLAKIGVSDVSTVNDMLSGIVQQLQKDGVPKDMATPLALAAIQKQGQAFTSQEVTYGNVVEAAMIKRALPNASDPQTAAIASLSMTQLQTLAQRDKQGKPTTAASELAKKIGIDDIFEQNYKLFEKGGKIQSAAAFGAEHNMYNPLYMQTERDRRSSRFVNNQGAIDVVEEFRKGTTGAKSDMKGGTTPGQEIAKNQAQQQLQLINAAGDFTKVMNGVVEDLKKVKEDLDPQKFQEDLEKSVLSKEIAETFKKSGEDLKEGSAALLNVSKKLEKAVNSMAGWEDMKRAADLASKGDVSGATKILLKMKSNK